MLLKNIVKIIARAKKLLNFYMIRRRGKEVKKKIPKEKYKRYFFSYAHAPDGAVPSRGVGVCVVKFLRGRGLERGTFSKESTPLHVSFAQKSIYFRLYVNR